MSTARTPVDEAATLLSLPAEMLRNIFSMLDATTECKCAMRVNIVEKASTNSSSQCLGVFACLDLCTLMSVGVFTTR